MLMISPKNFLAPSEGKRLLAKAIDTCSLTAGSWGGGGLSNVAFVLAQQELGGSNFKLVGWESGWRSL
jgi:hypothetical protein